MNSETKIRKNEIEQVDLGTLDAEEILQSIQPIVGLPLVDLWHPFSQVFEFGPVHSFENRKGELATRGMWVLDIECDWAVTRGAYVVLGSHDAAKNRKFYHRKTPPREHLARRRWQGARAFFEVVASQALKVASVEMEDTGFMRLRLSQEYAIHVFETSSKDGPLWRIWNSLTGVSYDVSIASGSVFVSKFVREPDATVD